MSSLSPELCDTLKYTKRKNIIAALLTEKQTKNISEDFLKISKTTSDFSFVYDTVITKTACNGQWLGIDCPAGSKINVRRAFYGRKTRDGVVCGPYASGVCRTRNALYKVRSRCQGKRWCKIKASQDFFGGYCSGPSNYVLVEYTCK